ncbi:TPA: hypothetical protein DF272_01770, partial [Candidatus Falkowbacteria bacterium]|nr:hypothetical protein [Candidatus Falkowbacteria bacterium]
MAFENIKLDKAQKQTLRELKSRNERANAGGAEVNLAKWQRDLESLSQEAGEIQSALDQCELACEQLGMVFDSQALKRRYPREKLNIAFDLNEDDDERVAIIEYPEADDEHRKLSAPEQAIEIQYYKLNNQADSLRASIIQLRQKISRLEQDMRGLTDREKQELEQLENLSGLEEAVE